jgi:hypothetical protein
LRIPKRIRAVQILFADGAAVGDAAYTAGGVLHDDTARAS